MDSNKSKMLIKKAVNARTELLEFLSDRRLSKEDKQNGCESTHNMLPCPGQSYGGSYEISDEDRVEFMDLYREASNTMLAAGREDLYIVEVPKPVSCLNGDLDFRQVTKSRLYKRHHVDKAVNVYHKVIRKYVDIKDDKMLRTFVLEKDEPTLKDNGLFSDGLHIVFPFIPADKNLKLLITYEAKKLAEKMDIFGDIKLENDYDDIYDISIFKNSKPTGWLLYGSRKPSGGLYKFKTMYTANLKRCKLKDYERLSDILSMRKYKDNQKVPYDFDKYDQEELENIIGKVYDSLGINKNKKAKKKKQKKTFEEGDDLEIEEEYDYCTAYNIKSYTDEELTEREYEGRRLCELLSADRASKYETWIMVCWALANVGHKLKEDFFKFSEKRNFNPESCQKEWQRAIDYEDENKIGLGSLRYWAKKDDPEGFNEFLNDFISPYMKDAEDGSHASIAKVLFQMYKDRFACASISKRKWYEFSNHRWVLIDGGYTLMNLISDEFASQFTLLVAQCIQMKNDNRVVRRRFLDNEGRDHGRDDVDKDASRLMKIVANLKNSSFKEKIMSECARRFYVRDFGDLLDANRDLIGFDNGVYDLQNKCFREGLPEDYITFSVGYDWKEYRDDHPYVLGIRNFFAKVQTEEILREYVLDLFASHLTGHILSNRFIIWTGFGSNGKSTAVEFFQEAFGEYCDTVAVTLLTRKAGSSSSATPEIASLRGKRFVVFQEPEGDDKIYVGNMKMFTGKDEIPARPLYGEPIKFRPQFRMILTCNRLPTIPSDDDGTWRRIRVTPWESEFLDPDVDITNPEKQFRKDYKLGDKMSKWKGAFMWLLIKQHFEKKNLGEVPIVEPPAVKISTKEYRADTSFYNQFMDESLVYTKGSSDFISISQLNDVFKDWYEENYNEKAPPRKELVNFFKGRRFKLNSTKLLEFKLREIQEDD